MAEIILAILLFGAGVASALGALLVLWANAMGGVTNATAVNNAPAAWLALFALPAFGGGILILVF